MPPMPSDFRLGLDRRVPRHHATVDGMVISLCSAENRLQAPISSGLIFQGYSWLFPRGRPTFAVFSSEVVLIYSIKY